ncbi:MULTISPECIES: NAD-dependent epimerase/dehydratase family protein [unclassified Streptomyces]|uniref:NAD-dependent epimerase/dehydratase family protein n=1 Tax=unclassified Streptomyces TaxID=2593676 RepID=UPI00380DC94B
MQILVIGATGYAGRRVSAALARAGHTVLGLARDASAPRPALSPWTRSSPSRGTSPSRRPGADTSTAPTWSSTC